MKVEKIWAELSAKAAQEVENTQEVELSEEQVELASMSKLESIYKQLDNAMSNAERGTTDIQNAAIKGLKITEDGLNLADEVLNEIKDIEAAAKELGATVDISGFQSGALSMKKALQNLSLYYNNAKRF